MNRKAISQFDSFDPEVIEAARDVANRAGVPLEAWIASVVPQQAVPTEQSPRRRSRTASQRLDSSSQIEAQRDAIDHLTTPLGARTPPAPLEALRGAPSEAGRPYGDGFAALMDRLDGLDRAMEAERRSAAAAEERRLEEIEARIDRAIKEGPVQQVTERLGDIERRVAQLGEQGPSARPPGKRGKAAAAEMREAVQEIRRRQRELSGQTEADGIIATMHRDLARRLGDEPAAPPQKLSLPPHVIEELQRESGRLREAIEQLATAADIATLERAVVALVERIDRARSDIDYAAIAAPIEAIRNRVELLADDIAGQTHAQVATDIHQLAGRLDDAVASDEDGEAKATLAILFDELENIRRLVEALARPERVQALVQGLQAISTQIAALRPAGAEAVSPALDDIQGDLLAAAPTDLADEIHALTAKVEDLHARAEEEAAERAQRSEQVAAGSDDMASIHAMLRSLAEKVDRLGERTGADHLDALERQVMSLADKIEAPHGLDPTLATLERTMGDLLQQVETLRDSAPTEAAIERVTRTAVAETLQGTGFAAGQGEIGLLRASLADMQARQVASDERLSVTLDGVQSALDRLVTRLGTIEAAPVLRAPSLDERLMASTSTEATRAARRPSQKDAAEPALRTGGDALLEPGSPRPGRAQAADAPGREPAVQPDAPAPAADGDIKTSFIAAARRAAQAAQAELAAEAPLERSIRVRPAPAASRPEGRIARLRAEIDRRRRPILLGLAAIVLTLGAIQAVSMSTGDGDQTPQLTAAPDTATPPTAQATATPPAGQAGTATDTPKPADTPAAPEASKAPETVKPSDAPKAAGQAIPDPVTTQALPTPKAPDAPSAPAKPGIPQASGVNALSSDLAALPPGLAKVKQAALNGDGGAVWDLAMREADGRGVQRDLTVASKLFEKLALAGYAPAQYKLGAHYEKGSGVSRDLVQAKLWYGRAAEQGHARAMHNLGVIFAENPGPSGKPDFATAASWFRQGAEHGVRDSQYNIAVLYARGLGLTQDLIQSYAWFAAAAGQGDEDAGKKLDDVAMKLSPPDLSRAKSLASSFKPRRLDAAVNEPPAPQDGAAPMTLLGVPAPGSTALAPPARKAI